MISEGLFSKGLLADETSPGLVWYLKFLVEALFAQDKLPFDYTSPTFFTTVDTLIKTQTNPGTKAVLTKMANIKQTKQSLMYSSDKGHDNLNSTLTRSYSQLLPPAIIEHRQPLQTQIANHPNQPSTQLQPPQAPPNFPPQGTTVNIGITPTRYPPNYYSPSSNVLPQTYGDTAVNSQVMAVSPLQTSTTLHPPPAHHPPTNTHQPQAVPLPVLIRNDIMIISRLNNDQRSEYRLSGLQNTGLTCNLNSVIQALNQIPLFATICQQYSSVTNGYLTKAFNDVFESIKNSVSKAKIGDLTSVNMDPFINSIHFPGFDARQMNDANDFFTRCMSALADEHKGSPLAQSMSSLFGGQRARILVSPAKTDPTKSITTVFTERFWDWSVPISPKNTLQEALESMGDPQTPTQGQDNVKVRELIYSLPPVLFISLRRWTSGPGGFQKNYGQFIFPDEINLKSLLTPLSSAEIMAAMQKRKQIKETKAQGDLSKTMIIRQFESDKELTKLFKFNEPRKKAQTICFQPNFLTLNTPQEFENERAEKKEKDAYYKSEHNYILAAVLVHSGTISFGHYYSYVRLGLNSVDGRKKNQWVKCDDSRISLVTKKEATEEQYGDGSRSNTAMMLMYVRKETIQDISKR
ncbi:putative Ubiquitin carboxyl-terminal hydrolase [Blattamonas nauphoetae]|uniref:Ubiquitin carboxyl-terminal hydrolase n=1 Tax=Blattamonas nauphoetae TaxID=2049346 RepID=A0ABQ9XRA6_9EUKA|nr:putative Ubiquitin carboxyl-terminal hydrolase [Blattamonas nauphoetae]